MKSGLSVGWPGHAMSPLILLPAACAAELAGCTIRVPVDVIKQRMQAGMQRSFSQCCSSIWQHDGLLGFYRGFQATVWRDLPFACLQFPLYEWFKHHWRNASGDNLQPWQGALCGSVSGAIAAALTIPMDVVKTRIMLSQHQNLASLWKREGIKGLFAGVGPRTAWIGLGGLIFFGVYEETLRLLAA